MQQAAAAGRSRGDGKVLTIIEHLRELRYRVIVSVIAIAIGVVASVWPLTKYVLHALVVPAQQQVPGFKLHQFQLLDYWSTYFRVSIVTGIALAMPVIVYQVLAFIVPGLTRGERRWVLRLVAGSTVLFLGGLAFAYYVELPRMLAFMLKPDAQDVQPTIGITSYVNAVMRIMFMTGVLFQAPLLMMALAKAHVINSAKLIRAWRYAVVVSVILASFLAPSLNPLTPIVVGVPIFGLYLLGVLLARLVEPRPAARSA